MEICKAPTLRLKAPNKHTHIMYIETENAIKKKKKHVYIDKCSRKSCLEVYIPENKKTVCGITDENVTRTFIDV